MNSISVLYTTAALMALVAVACTALCLAWSIPSWRRQLASLVVVSQARVPEIGGLTGWTAVSAVAWFQSELQSVQQPHGSVPTKCLPS